MMRSLDFSSCVGMKRTKKMGSNESREMKQCIGERMIFSVQLGAVLVLLGHKLMDFENAQDYHGQKWDGNELAGWPNQQPKKCRE